MKLMHCIIVSVIVLMVVGCEMFRPVEPDLPKITLKDSLIRVSDTLNAQIDEHLAQIRETDFDGKNITADEFMNFSANIPTLGDIAKEAAINGELYDVALAVTTYHDVMRPFVREEIIDMPDVPEWDVREDLQR